MTGLVLVTGGSRGIGASVCRCAAAAGWDVALAYRRDARAAEDVAGAVRGLGRRAYTFQADMGLPDHIDALLQTVESEAGTPTALVNNAGITGGIGPFASVPAEILRRVFDVNVLGTMLCTQGLARRWGELGIAGRVVNISSIAATSGAPGEYVHYAASKAAVDTFTLGLARELAGSRIRVNAVAPGTTATDIHAAGGDPDRANRVATRIPLQRAARPEEIAEAVVWLLSDKASYVTGAVLRVGGGL